MSKPALCIGKACAWRGGNHNRVSTFVGFQQLLAWCLLQAAAVVLALALTDQTLEQKKIAR